ncbi:sigma-70 family RNA polymerase sigma factor [Paenibacillus sp. TRM 82003]|nr:sigma-70 family RNA polymerase sigma factor [Paenibacillus sp. TRM 82003]
MDRIRRVRQARRGAAEAYTALFQEVEEELYRIAYVYMGNSEDALDVVQETAYRSFASIGELKEPRYFKTWLIRIAIRCAVDALRKRERTTPIGPERMELLQDGGAERDVSLALSLRELVETLEAEEKSVVLLRFHRDYTIREVADALGMPLGTAKTVLYRALKKLRIAAEEEDGYER